MSELPLADGDQFLACCHFAEIGPESIHLPPPVHWWSLGAAPIEVVRKTDGVTMRVRFAALCGRCHRRRKSGVPMERLVTQDAQWIGAAPEIDAIQ